MVSSHNRGQLPLAVPPPGATVTVIVPTFNRAHLLTRTLTSLFAQTIRVDQVILVDDGSTDDTANRVNALIDEHPEWAERFLFLRQENQGKSVALNLALAESSGSWISFNDSDDRWKVDKLQRQFEALVAFPDCGACFTDSVYMTGESDAGTTLHRGKLCLPETMGRLDDALTITGRLSHGIMMQSILVRSDIMKRVGSFDPIMRVAQDVDFVFRLAMVTPLCYVNRPLVEIDRPPGRTLGLTSEFTMQSVTRLALHERMFRKWLSLAVETPQTISMIEGRLQAARSALANRMVLQGERSAAMEVLDRSLAQRFSWRVWFKREFIRLRLERVLAFVYSFNHLRSGFPHER